MVSKNLPGGVQIIAGATRCLRSPPWLAPLAAKGARTLPWIGGITGMEPPQHDGLGQHRQTSGRRRTQGKMRGTATTRRI